jgi:hypothetical protein
MSPYSLRTFFFPEWVSLHFQSAKARGFPGGRTRIDLPLPPFLLLHLSAFSLEAEGGSRWIAW